MEWRIERSEPFLVYRASRMKRRLKAGLSAVFLRTRPRGSLVKPGELV